MRISTAPFQWNGESAWALRLWDTYTPESQPELRGLWHARTPDNPDTQMGKYMSNRVQYVASPDS